MALTLPVPTIVTDPPGAAAELEKPVQLRLGPLRHPDGREVAASDVQNVGAFVYRVTGGGEEIWNESEQRWQAAPASAADLDALTPIPFTAKPGEPMPWHGMLVAAGQKDKAGADRFTKAVNGTPRYRLRAYARTAGDTGSSSPSSDLTFVSGAENQRFAVSFDTATPRDCHRVRFGLKNDALANAGYVEIRASGGQEVEIANCDTNGAVLARVLLTADGEIHLEPKSGRSIVIAGTLEAEEIHYRPQNQTTKQYL